jgi:hypothetical protein
MDEGTAGVVGLIQQYAVVGLLNFIGCLEVPYKLAMILPQAYTLYHYIYITIIIALTFKKLSHHSAVS